MTDRVRFFSVIYVLCYVPLCLGDVSSNTIRNPFEFKAPPKVVAPKPEPPKQAPKVSKKKSVKKAPKATPLILNGIFHGDDDLYVIINQTVLVKGGSIEGWTITSIKKNTVYLSKGKTTKTLTLQE